MARKEKTYLVSWSIDIEATSFKAAAEQAETLFLSADNQTAWVYEVKDEKKRVRVVEVKKGVGRVKR